ncbi:hypothetical protein [Lysinibacillus sp. NPDC092081]|uniref:hypothetical protein n=1 Tax=Lysinibacillus sp. NPDC092081 TaxID=3364131 RepID=UPI003803A091
MDEMDTVKRAPISIFNVESNTAELKTSMRDIASLAGVLNELGSQQIYESPLEILRFLNTIQLLYEESLGLADVIEDTEMLYYRYRNTYIDDAPPTIKQLDHLIYILARNSWLTKQTRQIKLLDRGKRMMDALIRLANDSLAYYLQDDIGRSLFQARRDDSALDEERKEKVFDLYVNELQRKLIILSPKAHDDQYYNKFSTVVVVEHDSAVPISRTKTIRLLPY